MKINIISINFSLFLFLFIGCKKTPIEPSVVEPTKDKEPFELSYNPTELKTDTHLFSTGVSSSVAITPLLEEVSGIIPSLVNPNMFWLHEDSGSDPAIYLYAENGQRIKRFDISGIAATDYEEIAYGFGPNGNFDHILLGDIGDNNKKRSNITIYRFPEPNYWADTSAHTINQNVDQLTLYYPSKNGSIEKENAEAFFVDPVFGDLFLFTKNTTICKIMTVPAPLPYGSSATLKHIGTLNFRFQKITASDISADGKHILLKSYDYLFYWNRLNNEKLEDMFLREPLRIAYQSEAQGEAVCWIPNTLSYVTISEYKSGISPKFTFYNL